MRRREMQRTAPPATHTVATVIKDRRWWIAGAVVILLILMFLMTLWWKSIAQASPVLTSTQAKNVVLKQYPGKVTETALNNGIYTVQLQSAQGMYQVQVNGNSGAIQSIQQIGQSTVATTTPDSTGTTDSSSSGSSSSTATEPTTSTSTSTTDDSNSTNTSSSEDTSSTEDSTDTSDTTSTPTASSPPTSTNENNDNHNENNSNNNGGIANNQPQANEQPAIGTPNPNQPSAGAPVPPEDQRDRQEDRKDKQKAKDKNNAAKPPVFILKEKEAERIALAQVPGKVDDTDYEDDEDKGQSYYLVDIDTPDEREATVQVNAISGAVMSVTWDDVDDSDNEN